MPKSALKAKIAVRTQKPQSLQNNGNSEKSEKFAKSANSEIKENKELNGDLPIATVVIKNSLNKNYTSNKASSLKSWPKVDQPSPLDDISFIDSSSNEQSIISTSSSASDDNYASELRDEPPKILSHHASGESSESASEFGYKKLADNLHKNHESCTDLSDKFLKLSPANSASGLNCFGGRTNYYTRLSPDKGVSISLQVLLSFEVTG